MSGEAHQEDMGAKLNSMAQASGPGLHANSVGGLSIGGNTLSGIIGDPPPKMDLGIGGEGFDALIHVAKPALGDQQLTDLDQNFGAAKLGHELSEIKGVADTRASAGFSPGESLPDAAKVTSVTRSTG